MLAEILAFGGIVITTVLAYLLYRQQHLVALAQQALVTAEQRVQTLQNELAAKETAVIVKVADLAKLDALILKLRQDISAKETALSEQQQHYSQQQSIISNLRGQIETSERSSLESKALFSTISNVAFDLVFVLNEDRIVIALNQAADVLFAQKHPIGEKLTELIDAPELHEVIDRAMTEQEGLEEQIILEQHYYRVRTQYIHYDQKHTFIGIAMQDITQLVRLNRSRRDMVANISHELRTPIANIRLIIDGLFYDQNRPKRKASIASVRAIARETEVLLHLVQELYDLSMIESGQAIMRLIPVRLVTIVNDALARVQDQLNTKNLKTVVYVPEKLVVLCDYEQTRRVVINLVHNAMKWSPIGEIITISASGDGIEAEVSVLDKGPGVPPEQTERIFERFYQIDPSRSKKDGTGLGLAICKHIVEAQGGHIWAEGNASGGGGRFLFTLLDGGTETPVSEDLLPGQHDAGLNQLIANRYNGVPPAPEAVTNGADEGDIELLDDE